MKKLLRKVKNDKRGSTTIELVTTIFVMTVVLPAIIVLVSTTFSSREVANSLMSNAINSDSVQSSLNNDVETATALNVVDGNQLKLRSNDGTCKVWKLQDQNLVRATSETAITNDTAWVTVGEHFTALDSEEIFTKTASGIEYSFKVGKASVVNELRGSAIQKTANAGAGECW